jgi:hypothetical protein
MGEIDRALYCSVLEAPQNASKCATTGFDASNGYGGVGPANIRDTVVLGSVPLA